MVHSALTLSILNPFPNPNSPKYLLVALEPVCTGAIVLVVPPGLVTGENVASPEAAESNSEEDEDEEKEEAEEEVRIDTEDAGVEPGVGASEDEAGVALDCAAERVSPPDTDAGADDED